MENINILPLTEKDLPGVVSFCDKEIGKNYYTLDSLKKALAKSQKLGKCSSFIAYSAVGLKEVVGVRLTYAPGLWIQDFKGGGLSPDLWEVKPEYLACFKSLFIDDRYQKQGLGKTLSKMAIDILKQQGAKAILSHSALQSPNNSSQRYLQSMGFRSLREHLKFWEHIDYYCTHCKKRPCQCSALEMILYL